MDWEKAGADAVLGAGISDAVRPRLPIGVDSFAEICDGNYYYVDKTLLVKRLLDYGAKVVLFTRPRRFGKTLNLDMLRVFFEISEKDTARYFRDKKIWECGPQYTEQQGKYPVIHLSWRDVPSKTWDMAFDAIRVGLQAEYDRHFAVLDASRLTEWTRKKADRFMKEAPTEEQTRGALLHLTRVLHAAYGKPPVILIDEYDAPADAAWRNGYYDRLVDFMRGLLTSALKDNPHLSFACLTGVLRVARESIFSGLNHLKVDSVLSRQYEEFFGFTPDEVRELLATAGVENKYGEINMWYNGYRFGDQEVFNPWSVNSYLDERCVPQAYWANTSGNGVIKEIVGLADGKVAKDLTSLMEGGSVWSKVRDSLAYPDIGAAQGESARAVIYTLLLMAGYLTTTGKARGERNAVEMELVIPNCELEGVYQEEILERLGAPFTDLRDVVMSALRSGDAETIGKCLTELLGSASFFDLTDEGDYHMWLLGLLTCVADYRVLSNRESGNGRYDICFVPKIRSRPGILIEIKHEKRISDVELEKLARTAVGQIRARDYADELRAAGAGTILAFGMAFSGKRVRVLLDRVKLGD